MNRQTSARPAPRLRAGSRLSFPSLALAAAVLATGCGTRLNVAQPEGVVPAAELPELEPSVVHLPVTLSLVGIAEQVEGSVPTTGGDENEWHEAGSAPVIGTVFVKEMWVRDPLRIRVEGDHADVWAHVRYRARIAKKLCVPLAGCRWVPLTQCGHDGAMPSVDVGLRTTLAIGPSWTVVPHTTVRPIGTGVHCRLADARVDVTERVQAKVLSALQGAAPKVDAHIRRAAALRDRVEDVWRSLQQPIRVGDDAWLTLRPRAAGAGTPQGHGTALTAEVALVMSPQLMVGERPTPKLVPLPPRTPLPPGRGFHIQVVAEVPFASADSILQRQLVGRKLASGGHSVTIRRVHLSGGGARLVLAVDVSGDARGTLYFVGTPAFDAATQVLTVPDLDFSLETRDVLAGAASWLMYPSLREQMALAARFPLGARAVRLRERVDAAMNRNLGEHVRMTGGVDTLRAVGVAVRPNAIAAVLVADGHAAISIVGT